MGDGEDYTLASGTATITAGHTSTTIPLTVVDDTNLEGNETVEITLSNPSPNASIGVNSVYTYTIKDNDYIGYESHDTSVTPTSPGRAFSAHSSNGDNFKPQVDKIIPNNDVTPQAPSGLGRSLKLGITNAQVKLLQKLLNTKGYGVTTPGKETNYFGSKTKKAVMKFQKANKLKADGVVGPKTWALLNK